MDGAKLVTDTIDRSNASGRQAYCLGRSYSEMSCGPSSNENPGNSRNIAE